MTDDDRYWQFGKLEVVSILIGILVAAITSAALHLPPPWWLLPVVGPRSIRHSGFEWDEYARQGGYDHFWLQSLWGWMIVGAVAGLIFANTVIRKKSGLFDE